MESLPFFFRWSKTLKILNSCASTSWLLVTVLPEWLQLVQMLSECIREYLRAIAGLHCCPLGVVLPMRICDLTVSFFVLPSYLASLCFGENMFRIDILVHCQWFFATLPMLCRELDNFHRPGWMEYIISTASNGASKGDLISKY